MPSGRFARVGTVATGIIALTLAATLPAYADDPPAANAVAPPVVVVRPAALVPLYVSFGTLQALDTISTLHNVNGGATEANPMMNGLVRSPAAFVATKSALAVASIYCTETLWKRHRVAAIALMIGLNGVSAAVVARNYATRR